MAAKSPQEFAQALKDGGYATDPAYVQKLTGAIDRVSGGKTPSSWKVNDRTWAGVVEGEKVPVTRTAQDQVDVLAPFYEQGLGEMITEARKRGYSDKQIAERLTGAGPDLAARLKAQDTAVEGYGPTSVLRVFRDAGYGDLIDAARDRGYTDKEIADKLGGLEYQQGKQARTEADSRGFMGNAWEGAKNAAGDVVLGAKQVGARISGDDARLAQLQEEHRRELSSLERRATDNASGSTFGNVGVKVAPLFGRRGCNWWSRLGADGGRPSGSWHPGRHVDADNR